MGHLLHPTWGWPKDCRPADGHARQGGQRHMKFKSSQIDRLHLWGSFFGCRSGALWWLARRGAWDDTMTKAQRHKGRNTDWSQRFGTKKQASYFRTSSGHISKYPSCFCVFLMRPKNPVSSFQRWLRIFPCQCHHLRLDGLALLEVAAWPWKVTDRSDLIYTDLTWMGWVQFVFIFVKMVFTRRVSSQNLEYSFEILMILIPFRSTFPGVPAVSRIYNIQNRVEEDKAPDGRVCIHVSIQCVSWNLKPCCVCSSCYAPTSWRTWTTLLPLRLGHSLALVGGLCHAHRCWLASWVPWGKPCVATFPEKMRRDSLKLVWVTLATVKQNGCDPNAIWKVRCWNNRATAGNF